MSYKGNLLIAKPSLNDSFFSKSVVFITGDDPIKGTVGIVLNKLYDKKLYELVPDLDLDIDVYIGGPVNQDHLFVIHSRPDIIQGGIHIQKNYFWSGDYRQINTALKHQLIREDEIRFFIGYTGWEFIQVRTEINNEDWIVYKEENLNILRWEENLWKNELIKVDKRNIIWINFPANPQLN